MRTLYTIIVAFFLFCCSNDTAWSAGRNGHEFDYLDCVKNIPITDLYKYADGVQLEGGYVFMEKLKPDQKYANVSVVWDLPFGGLEATEAFAHGSEKFRESRLEHYNESQVIYLISDLIYYYFKESAPDKKNVFLFFAGKQTGLNLFEVAERILKKYDTNLIFEKCDLSGTKIGTLRDKEGHVMEFVTHYCWLSSKIFQDASTVIGYSWNGGFNKAYRSGDFVIPTQFIKICKGKKFSVLLLDEKYEIKNDFQNNLQKFLKTQDPKLVEIVNSEFRSENPLKASHLARLIEERDFYQNATLLETWEIFEPAKWPKDVAIPD